MHSVPVASLAYKFILMLVECIYFEVEVRRSWRATKVAGQWASCRIALGPSESK